MIKKYMYKVYYIKGGELREALFDDKETAEQFRELVKGNLNRWKWEVQIEE